MTNLYFIQLIGVLLTLAGAVALTAAAHIFGTPLTDKEEERYKLGKGGNWYRLPINLETIASAAVFLAGIGVLKWSNFNLCAFLAHWLPNTTRGNSPFAFLPPKVISSPINSAF